MSEPNSRSNVKIESDSECSFKLDDNCSSRFKFSPSPDLLKQSGDGVQVNSPKSQNTLKQETWALRIWSDWATQRSSMALPSKTPMHPIPNELTSSTDTSLIEHWLPYFVDEIRTASGEEYNPDSKRGMIAALCRHLRDNCQYRGPSFLSRGSDINRTLKAKLCTNGSKTNQTNQCNSRRGNVITSDDERRLWNSGVMSMKTASGLLNAVFFYTGKIINLIGRHDHRNLRLEQFHLKSDKNNRKYIEFWPQVPLTEKPLIHYENEENPRSYYKIIGLYLSSLKWTTGPFYRRPSPLNFENGRLAYCHNPLGVNRLAVILKEMFVQAGIPVESRVVTNCALRATAMHNLAGAGLMSAAMRAGVKQDYPFEDYQTQVIASRCLDPILPGSKLDEESDFSDESVDFRYDGDDDQSEALNMKVQRADVDKLVTDEESGAKKRKPDEESGAKKRKLESEKPLATTNAAIEPVRPEACVELEEQEMFIEQQQDLLKQKITQIKNQHEAVCGIDCSFRRCLPPQNGKSPTQSVIRWSNEDSTFKITEQRCPTPPSDIENIGHVDGIEIVIRKGDKRIRIRM